MPGAVAKIVDEEVKRTGESRTQVVQRSIEAALGSAPKEIQNYAHAILSPMTLSDEGKAIAATTYTAQMGIKSTTYAPDRRVREAQERQIQPTAENLVWTYNSSVSVQAIVHLIAQTIIGAGWSVSSKDEEAKKLIEDFYDKMNLPDWLETTIEICAIYGNDLSVPLWDEDSKDFGELIHVDWSTITVAKHPLEPQWIRYRQKLKIPSKKGLPTTETAWKNYDLAQLTQRNEDYEQDIEPDDVIHTKVRSRGLEVGRSPLTPVITLTVYEKLLEYFMNQAAEIYGAPRVLAYPDISVLPAPEDQTSKTALQDQMAQVTEALLRFRVFGVLTLPPGWKVEVVGLAQHIFNYETLLTYIHKLQMLAFLGSMALFEASGTELATSRTIESIWGNTPDYWRRVLKTTLDRRVNPMYLKLHNKEGVQVEIDFNSEKKWTAQEGAQLVQAGIITKEEAREEWGYPEQPPQPELPPTGQPPEMTPQIPPIPADQANPPAPKEWGELVGTMPAGFELSNQRPKRDQKYEERSRRIEEATAKACQESLERAKQRIRSITPPEEPEPKK